MEKGQSIIESLILLKNCKDKKQRKEIFKEVSNITNGLKPIVKYPAFSKIKKIYYKYQIKRRLQNLDENDLKILDELYHYHLKDIEVNEEVKKKAVKYFGKTNNLQKTLLANYYNLYDVLSLNLETKSRMFIDGGDFYFSRIVSRDTLKRLNERDIFKLKDLEGRIIKVNDIEYSNICRYIDDLNNYYLNDSLFLSLLDNEERELFDLYLECNSYVLLSEKIGFSQTEARARIYTSIYKMIKFFDSYEGLRVIDMIFAHEECKVSVSKLQEMFPKYYKYIIYLVKNNYIYKTEFINNLDIIVIK